MKDKIKPLKIGIRCQDIQTCTQDLSLKDLAVEFKNIILLGKAERLALHIRGTEILKDIDRLELMACQFDIGPDALPKVLSVLEEIGWIRTTKKYNQIVIIEETVPFFKDIYSIAGDYYLSIKTHESEDAIIEVLDSLALSPNFENEIKKKFNIDDRLYGIIMDMGKNGGIIDEVKLEDQQDKMLYTPIYWTENPSKMQAVYELLKKYGSEKILNVLKKVQDYQGIPIPDMILKNKNQVPNEDLQIYSDFIKSGILLAPKVKSFSGEKHFAFIPYQGISIEEKVILEKAMAILACVRYGQNFGSITKIKSPEILLEKLSKSPYKIGPHTEIRQQYAILVGRGIGRIYKDKFYSDRWYFELIEKEDNIKAVKLAIDLLTIGQAIYGKHFEKELQEFLFYSGTYDEAIRTIPKLKKNIKISKITSEYMFDLLNNIRGANI